MCFALGSIFMALYISGCASNKNLSITTQTPVNTQAVQLPITTQAAQNIKAIVYDEYYLQDCKQIYPPKYNQQVGFYEVYPGITTDTEIIKQFGSSYEYSEFNDQEEYFYKDSGVTYAYSFSVTNHLAGDIAIVADAEILLPLQKILDKYGCPDLIIAETLSDDPFAESLNYNGTLFVYLDEGIRINFDKYPIDLLSVPIVVAFVKPAFAQDYLESDFLNFPGWALTSYSEAIVDK